MIEEDFKLLNLLSDDELLNGYLKNNYYTLLIDNNKIRLGGVEIDFVMFSAVKNTNSLFPIEVSDYVLYITHNRPHLLDRCKMMLVFS